jgi:phenylacetate-CoA ligase
MWLSYGWFGVEMGDRGVRLWGTPYSSKRRIVTQAADFFMNRIRFSAFEFDDQVLGRYWRELVKFSPDYVHGYVSMLEQMARFGLREGIAPADLQLKSVIATSEVLTEPQRRVIEEAFGAPVQIEYGCGEAGPIAHECPHGSLHLAAANLVVELLRPDGTPAAPGETGEIVLTDLHNKAMPLIRYRIGDFGVLGTECPCGRAFPVLEKVWGRAYDFIEDPAGRRYHGEFFMYVFEDLRSDGIPVGQFQVIQRDPSSVELLITAERPLDDSACDRILSLASRRLPGVEIELEQVEEIPREASGKMRVIKREGRSDQAAPE